LGVGRKGANLLVYFLAFNLFFLPVLAEAVNWKLIAKSKNGNMSIFIDNESIRHISKTIVRARVKLSFEKMEPMKSKYIKEVINYREDSCSEKKRRSIKSSFYYSDGTIDTSKGQWQYIAPGTIDYVVHDYLCNKSK
jgi:hypothetical protein